MYCFFVFLQGVLFIFILNKEFVIFCSIIELNCMLFVAGICWQKQVTLYLLPSLEQSSISKDD
jgi:hypothetical protein